MTSQFSYMTLSSNFFDVVSLVKFNCWSKFYVSIITGSGVMIISFYKRLIRNPEIGNTPVWVLPNIWRLWRVRNTKFGRNVSKKMLLNATKYQRYSFYRFWVSKGKPTGGGVYPPLIRVKCLQYALRSLACNRNLYLIIIRAKKFYVWIPYF